MERDGLPRRQPALDGGHLVLAYNNLDVGEGGYVDAHLTEEIGGELADGSAADLLVTPILVSKCKVFGKETSKDTKESKE